MRWVIVTEEERVADEAMLEVTVDGKPIVIYRVGADLYATDGICTHGQAALIDGWLEGTVIECPLHGGCFDVRTGEGLGPPVDRGLATYPVRRRSGQIELALRSDEGAT